jgi:hypothetical protein
MLRVKIQQGPPGRWLVLALKAAAQADTLRVVAVRGPAAAVLLRASGVSGCQPATL